MTRSHPRVHVRGARPANAGQVRTMVYSPSHERMQMMADELGHTVIQLGRGVEDVVAALVDDPPPRPQVLVLDVDLLSAGDLFYLHSIRERGWCGTIIALGTVPSQLRRSMNIDTLLPHRSPPQALRDAVDAIRFDAQTTQMRVVG